MLGLLKSRLWAILWEEPGGSAAAATLTGDKLASALRREFSFVGGQLYSDLYDRNCRRRFCNEATFRGPSMGPERLNPDRFAQVGPWSSCEALLLVGWTVPGWEALLLCQCTFESCGADWRCWCHFIAGAFGHGMSKMLYNSRQGAAAGFVQLVQSATLPHQG